MDIYKCPRLKTGEHFLNTEREQDCHAVQKIRRFSCPYQPFFHDTIFGFHYLETQIVSCFLEPHHNGKAFFRQFSNWHDNLVSIFGNQK